MKTTLAMTLALAAALAVPSGAAGREAAPRFRLDILTASWHDLERVQDWESAWPRLQDAADNVFFSIDERDVAAYDGQAPRIVLRPEAGTRLLSAAQKLPRMPERLHKLRALWSTDDLQSIVDLRAFVVSLDGRPLYGGIFLDERSTLSTDYPVLRSAIDDGRRIVLSFSPIHVSFGSLWDDDTGDALEPEIDPAPDGMPQVFGGVPEKMPPERRKQRERFRHLIRNPEIQAFFAQRGTPAKPPAATAWKRKPLPALPAIVSVNPYSQSADAGWSLYFGVPDTVADIRYRLPDDPGDSGWHVAGPQGEAGLGRLAPGRHRVDVEALDFAGETVGRYSLWLDPEREAILAAKHVLEMTYNSWLSFSDREESSYLFYSHLQRNREAIKEARYSLDNCNLDRSFLLVPEKKDSQSEYGYFRVSPDVSYVCLQLAFRDGETPAPRRFYHHPEEIARDAGPPAMPAEPPGKPLPLSVSHSNSGWSLHFEIETPVREIRYRLADDPEWRSTRPDTRIHLPTGERLPNSWIVLEDHKATLGRHRIDVRFTGFDGVESGLHTAWFDPEREILDNAKQELRRPDSVWARFDRDSENETLVMLSTVSSSMDALSEVRYSLDGCGLDRKVPFKPWTYLGEKTRNYDHSYLWLPRTLKSFCIQLVFRDGEVTEAREYSRGGT